MSVMRWAVASTPLLIHVENVILNRSSTDMTPHNRRYRLPVQQRLRTCFLDRRSFWNFTLEATINKMFMDRWKSLKLMRSGNFKRF